MPPKYTLKQFGWSPDEFYEYLLLQNGGNYSDAVTVLKSTIQYDIKMGGIHTDRPCFEVVAFLKHVSTVY